MKLSFRKFFRIIFVIFFLYLLGEGFNRWDGFRMFASFSDFIPAAALTTILSIIPLLLSIILIWTLVLPFEWFFQMVGWKIKIEHVMLHAGFFVLFGALALSGKKLIWPFATASIQIKLLVFICFFVVSIFLTWLLGKKAQRWIDIVQERITPLVWLFGIWIVISVPIVVYHTWIKEQDKVVSLKTAPSFDEDSPNIILVTFDTLRAESMSVYGYIRPTTPFINKWAKDATIFTMAEAASNETAPTTASLMTGKEVWSHHRHNWGKPSRADIENLPLLLRNKGYFNMAFIMNDVASVKSLNISNHFDIAPTPAYLSDPHSLIGKLYILVDHMFEGKIILHNWFLRGDFLWGYIFRKIHFENFETSYPPANAFKEFLDIIDRIPPRKPFFVWIHVLPPHEPYLPSEVYKGMFNSSTELRDSQAQSDFVYELSLLLWSFQPLPHEMNRKMELIKDYYEEFIMYCDKQFEDFITELKRRTLSKKTIIILSADHGESFEHNYPNHGGPHLYEQVTHIPLIIKGADPQSKGRLVNDFVEQIDIPATILDLANINVPSWMEGRSLVPLMYGQSLPNKPVFSMNFFKNNTNQKISKGTIAVREGDYKLIHYMEREEYLLFNLKEDPSELTNLFIEKTDVGQHLLALIRDNLKKANDRIEEAENFIGK